MGLFQVGSYWIQSQLKPLTVNLKSKPSPILILLWPKNAITWVQSKKFLQSHDSRCKFTEDTTLVHVADVLLHYVYDTNEKLPNIDYHNHSQLRVFFQAESPVLFNSDPGTWSSLANNSYHWTFSYRRDSNVVGSYGSFNPLPNVLPFSPAEIQMLKNRSMEIPKNKLENLEKVYVKGRKLVAWAVSHCETQSKRERFIHKLAQFVPIDIYGSCKGGMKCPRDIPSQIRSNCQETLGPQYKFYLSFENALCLDYVTEKFFRALKFDMVPIVYGGVNNEYETVAPPGSYINVRDFPSAEKLANYIKFLDENPEEYLKYFLWKEKYWIFSGLPYWDICTKVYALSTVNEAGKRVIPRNYTGSNKVKDVTSWWFKGREEKGNEVVCVNPPAFVYE